MRIAVLLLAACSSGGTGADDAASDALKIVDTDIAGQDFPDPFDAPEGLYDAGDRPRGEVDSAGGADALPDVLAEDAVHVALPSCECDGPVLFVTVNAIPAEMNGSEPFLNNQLVEEDFHLAVPESGFAWDVYVDCPCGCQPEGLAVWSDAAAGELAAGEDLSLLFTTESEGHLRWVVGEEHAFEPGYPILLGAVVEDVCGNEAAPSELPVEIAELTPELDPFDLVDPWVMAYHRDHQTITWQFDAEGKAFVQANSEPNGIPDFFEDLWTAGLGTPQPLAEFEQMECDGFSGGNECLARLLLEKTRQHAYQAYKRGPTGGTLHDSVNITFWIEGEEGAPDPSEFAYQYLEGGETEKSFSLIGFGGGDLAQSLVGLSETVDEWNIQNENNAKGFYGCLTTSLVRYFFELVYEDEDVYALASMALSGVMPSMGGVAIGALEGDHLVVDFSVPVEQLPPASAERRKVLSLALDILGTGLGALTAHEVGHSLGMVAYGPPPYGLFGSEKNASFVVNEAGCKGAHLDTEGPNLMAAGPGSGNMSSLDMSYLTTQPFFNELNLAYLQGRIVLLPQDYR